MEQRNNFISTNTQNMNFNQPVQNWFDDTFALGMNDFNRAMSNMSQLMNGNNMASTTYTFNTNGYGNNTVTYQQTTNTVATNNNGFRKTIINVNNNVDGISSNNLRHTVHLPQAKLKIQSAPLPQQNNNYINHATIEAKYDNKSPLICAVHAGNYDDVLYWLDKGIDINVRDSNNSTPLILAAWYGYLPIVNLLIKRGAALHLKNINNCDALGAAEESGHQLVINLIEDYIRSKRTLSAPPRINENTPVSQLSIFNTKHQNNQNQTSYPIQQPSTSKATILEKTEISKPQNTNNNNAQLNSIIQAPPIKNEKLSIKEKNKLRTFVDKRCGKANLKKLAKSLFNGRILTKYEYALYWFVKADNHLRKNSSSQMYWHLWCDSKKYLDLLLKKGTDRNYIILPSLNSPKTILDLASEIPAQNDDANSIKHELLLRLREAGAKPYNLNQFLENLLAFKYGHKTFSYFLEHYSNEFTQTIVRNIILKGISLSAGLYDIAEQKNVGNCLYELTQKFPQSDLKSQYTTIIDKAGRLTYAGSSGQSNSKPTKVKNANSSHNDAKIAFKIIKRGLNAAEDIMEEYNQDTTNNNNSFYPNMDY